MELAERLSAPVITDKPEDVIRRYQNMVYRVAYACCQNYSDAEDVTQEVFIRYIKKTFGFAEEEHLKAWLIRVTMNVSKNFLRSARRKKTVPISTIESMETQAPEHNSVYRAVMALAEKYRVTVLLYYFEDYSVREIAALLNRSETAVQTQLQRARAKLKEQLKEDWQNE